MTLERDPYKTLGVRRLINAATTLTALGGTVLADEVVEAMVGASRSCVSMDELHAAASIRLAQLTNNEDAYVTSGCAAGLSLAVLGAITKGRPELINRLPDDESLARNVVIHRAHRIPYDRAVELGAGHLVEIGNVVQTFTWELEAALDDRTVAVVWVAGSHLPQTALGLKETVAIAHERGVPVIVDAAAQLPPVENLSYFTKQCGADAALFSGGKGLQGPQASGLVVGSRDFLDAMRANASPWQRLARAMKVGKEEICGLVAALERYVTLDHVAITNELVATVDEWAKGLNDLDDVHASRLDLNEAGQPVPRLEVRLDSGLLASAVLTALWDGNPRVAVLAGGEHHFFVTPDTLVEGQADVVLERLLTAIRFEQTSTSRVGGL